MTSQKWKVAGQFSTAPLPSSSDIGVWYSATPEAFWIAELSRYIYFFNWQIEW